MGDSISVSWKWGIDPKKTWKSMMFVASTFPIIFTIPKKIESHHFQKLYMEVTHMWKIETSWRYCLIAVDGVQHDIWPERLHSTLPRRSAKVSFCWKLSTTASINQFRQFPFPTFWRFFVCAELRDKSCLESMPFFRSFFLPELPVTGIFLNQTKRFCALASSPK